MKRSLLTAVLLTAAAVLPAKAAPTFKTIYAIPSSGDGCGFASARAPFFLHLPASQVVAYDGRLYGTTPGCGAYGLGTIFRYDPHTGVEKDLYDFTGNADGGQPQAALTLVGGMFYGTTTGGGVSLGTVFKFDPASGIETPLHDFSDSGVMDGAAPTAPLLAFNGLLFGTTSQGGSSGNGTIFSVDPVSGAEQVVYEFLGGSDGAQPQAGLVAYGGLLYGTTASAGSYSTVFSFDPATGTERVLHTLQGADGSFAVSGVTVLNNQLYGVTQGGGASGLGALYQVDPSTGAEAVLYSFNGDGGSQSGLLASGNLLYGSTSYPASVFSFNPAAGSPDTLYVFPDTFDGNAPAATSVIFDGLLYGTDVSAGDSPSSTLFTIDPNSGAQAVAHRFTGAFGGDHTGLAALGSVLGVTSIVGGSLGQGAVLSVDPSSGAGTQLASFSAGIAGSAPNTPVVQVGDAIYGTTRAGGLHGEGTIFKIDSSGATTIIHDFGDGTDGNEPMAGLTLFGNKLYGTTSFGSTLFSLDPATGVMTTLLTFPGSIGNDVNTTLTVAGNLLYGTSRYGGAHPLGTVFSFDPATGKARVIHAFAKGDARRPNSQLVVSGAALYGTSDYGAIGAGSGGALYRIDLSTGAETVVFNFVGKKNSIGPSSLTVSGNLLYGTTVGGGAVDGTVFKFDPVSRSLTTLHAFTGGADGAAPSDLISLGTMLYGTTDQGGAFGLGTVFRINP